jgi:hypothetical protein
LTSSSTNNEFVGEIHACGKEDICSFYSTISSFVDLTVDLIIDLKGKDAWVS